MSDEYELMRSLIPARPGDGILIPERPSADAVLYGRIGTDGALPAALPAVCKVIPDTVTFPESVGASKTIAAAPSKIYAAIIGTGKPAVGDQVVCFHVGNRWVCFRTAAAPATPPPATIPCMGCASVKKADMGFSLTYKEVQNGMVSCDGSVLPHTQTVSGTLRFVNKPLYSTGFGATKKADFHWVYGPYIAETHGFNSSCPPITTVPSTGFFYAPTKRHIVVICGTAYWTSSSSPSVNDDGGYREDATAAFLTHSAPYSRPIVKSACSPFRGRALYDSASGCPNPILPLSVCAGFLFDLTVSEP